MEKMTCGCYLERRKGDVRGGSPEEGRMTWRGHNSRSGRSSRGYLRLPPFKVPLLLSLSSATGGERSRHLTVAVPLPRRCWWVSSSVAPGKPGRAWLGRDVARNKDKNTPVEGGEVVRQTASLVCWEQGAATLHKRPREGAGLDERGRRGRRWR